MSILFVLLTFLLIISVTYFRKGAGESLQVSAEVPSFARPKTPYMANELGFEVPKGYCFHPFEVPKGYCFHPGHTWVNDEGRQNARIGIDSFAANVFGKIETIEVVGLNRWVRQGQKLMTLNFDGTSVDLLAPIEGVITTVNHEVIKNPMLAIDDPYRDGWICVIKSPELSMNVKNLVQGTLVAPWMQNSLNSVRAMAQQLAPALAQDGGTPVKGLLSLLDPNSRRKLITEFFLS